MNRNIFCHFAFLIKFISLVMYLFFASYVIWNTFLRPKFSQMFLSFCLFVSNVTQLLYTSLKHYVFQLNFCTFQRFSFKLLVIQICKHFFFIFQVKQYRVLLIFHHNLSWITLPLEYKHGEVCFYSVNVLCDWIDPHTVTVHCTKYNLSYNMSTYIIY